MPGPLHVLLTNDDGVHAPGLLAMRHALAAVGFTVTVCAPDRPRSASGHAITLHKPLRCNAVSLADASPAWSCSGLPADCVLLAFSQFAPESGAFDIVVSGINHGPNLGWDVTYSGTVAAAMESVIKGVPAIAVSMASYEPAPHWETPARYVAGDLVERTVREGLPSATLLNVNAPNVPEHAVRGVRVTRQGERHYSDQHEARLDPNGAPYYWLAGTPEDYNPAAGTDIEAVKSRYISVTPVHLDLTNPHFLDPLRAWGIEEERSAP
ncbi:MAG: 5'/3'-nucleotidase SurE [Armatimonadota bacterium]